MPAYPLQGYRVVDMGWVWAGPVVAAILADMGAEVIKVESQKHLDSMRVSPDNLTMDPERDPWFHSANRNKLGITIDIAHPAGRALVKGLVAVSDVVVENFSPRVLKQHGLDYASLSQVKPDIIMISLPAAGQYGPLRDIVTYGPSLSALAGLDSMIGYYGERALGGQHGYADPNSAIHGAFAILAALYYRRRSGEGQYIDMAQMEAVVSCLGEAVMEYVMKGRVMGTQGNHHPTLAPHNNYPCRGEDKWVSIAVKTEEEWRGLCRAMGDPAWTREEKFADAFGRLRHREELDEHIARWTREHTHYEATRLLQQAGVAAAPCLDIGERYVDAHFQERQTFLEYPHPISGIDAIAGIPFKFSKTPGEVRRAAPTLGEHNEYVFRQLLGIPQAEVDRLVEEKVLY